MGQLVDSDKVVAMLRQEAREWATFAQSGAVVTDGGKRQAAGISLGYKAAAKDVQDMVRKQAAGNVPADSSE